MSTKPIHYLAVTRLRAALGTSWFELDRYRRELSELSPDAYVDDSPIWRADRLEEIGQAIIRYENECTALENKIEQEAREQRVEKIAALARYIRARTGKELQETCRQ